MNTPYRKQYDENGILTNPITKIKSYLHPFPNRRVRKAMVKNNFPKNNKKGIRLIVTPIINSEGKREFVKTYVSLQKIGNKTIQHNLIN